MLLFVSAICLPTQLLGDCFVCEQEVKCLLSFTLSLVGARAPMQCAAKHREKCASGTKLKRKSLEKNGALARWDIYYVP